MDNTACGWTDGHEYPCTLCCQVIYQPVRRVWWDYVSSTQSHQQSYRWIPGLLTIHPSTHPSIHPPIHPSILIFPCLDQYSGTTRVKKYQSILLFTVYHKTHCQSSITDAKYASAQHKGLTSLLNLMLPKRKINLENRWHFIAVSFMMFHLHNTNVSLFERDTQ